MAAFVVMVSAAFELMLAESSSTRLAAPFFPFGTPPAGPDLFRGVASQRGGVVVFSGKECLSRSSCA